MDTRIPDRRLEKWLHVAREDHSTDGNLDLTFGEEWLPDISDIFTAAEQSGHQVNPDVNRGDPIGMGMGTVCISRGIRATSSSAYLSRPPPNLRILPDAPVARVLFEGKRAVGVETTDTRRFTAKREVILCGGALNTPQILMLSGIGAAHELNQNGIPLVHDSPMVGKNLQDHCFAAAGLVLRKDSDQGLGPGSQSPTPMGWFQLPSVTSSEEYQELPDRVKRHMNKPTVPHMEIASVRPVLQITRRPLIQV